MRKIAEEKLAAARAKEEADKLAADEAKKIPSVAGGVGVGAGGGVGGTMTVLAFTLDSEGGGAAGEGNKGGADAGATGGGTGGDKTGPSESTSSKKNSLTEGGAADGKEVETRGRKKGCLGLARRAIANIEDDEVKVSCLDLSCKNAQPSHCTTYTRSPLGGDR